MSESQPTSKPERLYFKSYLQMIHNSVGSQQYRNFYIRRPDGSEMDALADGSDSCAMFASALLTLFGKNTHIHGTVASTLKDLEHCGWQTVAMSAMLPGDVLLWEAQQFDDGPAQHIGFYIGDDRAVSTSWKEKRVVEHDVHFDSQRNIELVFHHDAWEQPWYSQT